jgi:predicted P-loop ATPase
VRRVRQPGCKFDEMIVLESEQGTNKSSALATLAVREDWFTDDLPLNADSKVVIERLAGRWIVEAAELKGMRKGDVEGLKAFLSRQHDRARAAYARLPQEVARQCVIVGTTNSERYLKDGTGNRRFWPVQVEGFNLEALRRDREQLWAEAAAREADGAEIRLDRALWADAAEQQDARQVEDPYVAALDAKLCDQTGKLRAADAWELLGMPAGQRTQDHNARLGDAMRVLGWERTKLRFGGQQPEWCYVKGTFEQRRQQVKVVRGEVDVQVPF